MTEKKSDEDLWGTAQKPKTSQWDRDKKREVPWWSSGWEQGSIKSHQPNTTEKNKAAASEMSEARWWKRCIM